MVCENLDACIIAHLLANFKAIGLRAWKRPCDYVQVSRSFCSCKFDLKLSRRSELKALVTIHGSNMMPESHGDPDHGGAPSVCSICYTLLN